MERACFSEARLVWSGCVLLASCVSFPRERTSATISAGVSRVTVGDCRDRSLVVTVRLPSPVGFARGGAGRVQGRSPPSQMHCPSRKESFPFPSRSPHSILREIAKLSAHSLVRRSAPISLLQCYQDCPVVKSNSDNQNGSRRCLELPPEELRKGIAQVQGVLEPGWFDQEVRAQRVPSVLQAVRLGHWFHQVPLSRPNQRNLDYLSCIFGFVVCKS